MRKLRNWERYVLFPKTKDSPLEGEIPLDITQKEVKAHKAWPKPFAFVRALFDAFTPMLRTRAVTASGQGNPFFGNPSTALRVGFDSLPKNSRSGVEQQSKTSRTTLEEESKRSRRSLEQQPNESRTAVEHYSKEKDVNRHGMESIRQQRQSSEPGRSRFLWASVVPSRDLVRYSFAICLVFLCLFSAYPLPFLCLLFGVSLLILCLYTKRLTNNEATLATGISQLGEEQSRRSRNTEVCSKVVHSCPEQVLRTRSVCVKYSPSTDIVLNEYTLKGLFSMVKWPYGMSISYKIAGILKAIANKNGTSTIHSAYCANTADLINTLPDTYQVLPNYHRHGFSTASRRLRSPMAIGARSDNDQSAKPEMQNKGRRKVEARQNLVRTKRTKNVINLWSTYQKATVSIRVTYQKYTLDLLKSYQRLTKKLLTPYQEVRNRLVAVCRNATANIHAFGSLRIASIWRGWILPSRGSVMSSIFLLCLVVLFSEAQAQSAGERAVAEANDINPLQIGDTIPDELWNLPLQVVNHPDGKDTITLNDYRDKKLIILDFWATWCSACTEAFPLTERYNKLFAKDLKIIAVNSTATKDEKSKIETFFKTMHGNGIETPLSVYEERDVEKYFPWKSLPQLIWIVDGKRFAYSTFGTALTRKNIKTVLEGHKPLMLEKVVALNYDENEPMFASGMSIVDTPIFYSYFGGFKKGVHFSNGRFYPIRGNKAGTLYRNLNSPLITMYQSAFATEFKNIDEHFIAFDSTVDAGFERKLFDRDEQMLCCFELYHSSAKIDTPLRYLRNSLLRIFPYVPTRVKKTTPVLELKATKKLNSSISVDATKEIYTDSMGNISGTYANMNEFLFMVNRKMGIPISDLTGFRGNLDFFIPNTIDFTDLEQGCLFLQNLGFATAIRQEERDFLVFKSNSNL